MTNQVLGYISKSIDSRLREVVIILYSTPVKPNLGTAFPLYERDIEKLRFVQQGANKMYGYPEHKTYKEKPQVLGLFILKRSRTSKCH